MDPAGHAPGTGSSRQALPLGPRPDDSQRWLNPPCGEHRVIQPPSRILASELLERLRQQDHKFAAYWAGSEARESTVDGCPCDEDLEDPVAAQPQRWKPLNKRDQGCRASPRWKAWTLGGVTSSSLCWRLKKLETNVQRCSKSLPQCWEYSCAPPRPAAGLRNLQAPSSTARLRTDHTVKDVEGGAVLSDPAHSAPKRACFLFLY
ncbi:uncharacterized protein LOC110348498 [Heterocephalus glaber]|uniref:Uncharacterized protein LOC110348498 n=1 Tax=Heterocephalus glaber TaxID=10181 RepID=A0AAX6SQ93_HETGA|nr:uncharacterized protein LOC110348498 [Heterocephalus glaber]